MNGKPKIIPEILKIGNYVKKKNHSLFSNEHIILKIESVVGFGPNKFKINSHWIIKNPNDSLIQSDSEEKIVLEQAFDECKHLSSCVSDEWKCISEDNNEPKRKLTEKYFPEVLYKFRQKYPDKKFQAYYCDICNNIHIGKIQ